MQPSRRAFLFGRRLPRTPWDTFRQRLERAAQGQVHELEAGPPGRARLVPARAEDVRHARALCVEYGVALLLDGMDQTNDELAGRPVLQVDPSGLAGLEPGPQPRQWLAGPGCPVGALAEVGLEQFRDAPAAITLAAWLAGPHAWPPGATAASGVLGADVLLCDGTAETLGPFGQGDLRPLRSATVQRLVPALFQVSASADAAACRAHADWPCRYRLDALLPAAPADVNLAQLLLGHGGTLAWVEQVLIGPGAPPPAAPAAPPPAELAGPARRIEVRVKDAFDPLDLYAP
ncbi:hypothetical protein [Bordetella petrii]|uniref:hypothetical protein n=1 Tax=Bordetella petrii TaxID=94624 RepID=UPI001A96435E|nr:hypothetical protein [Bordetella petrii]MBO1113354.1 hypothetical protein [Bordetella petrii]